MYELFHGYYFNVNKPHNFIATNLLQYNSFTKKRYKDQFRLAKRIAKCLIFV